LHFLLLLIFLAAASNFVRCEALMRSPRPPPRRAHLFLFTTCGLFTKKFELYFKGSPSTSSGQARECPHPLAEPSLPLAVSFRSFMRRRGLRPRLFFARAIFLSLGQVLSFYVFQKQRKSCVSCFCVKMSSIFNNHKFCPKFFRNFLTFRYRSIIVS